MSILWVLLLWVVVIPAALTAALNSYIAYGRWRRGRHAMQSRPLTVQPPRSARPPSDHWRRRPAQLGLRSGSSGLGAFHGRR